MRRNICLRKETLGFVQPVLGKTSFELVLSIGKINRRVLDSLYLYWVISSRKLSGKRRVFYNKLSHLSLTRIHAIISLVGMNGTAVQVATNR